MKPIRPLLLTTLGASLVAAGCSQHTPPPAARELAPAKVRIHAVNFQEVAHPIAVTGTVRPVQRATIAAKVMGVIAELPVALGQRVNAGDPLVVIVAGEISARLAQAEAQVNQARRDLARERTLLEQNASTPDMVKSLEDRVAMTEAMVREAEAMLGYTTIAAPFAGIVARKHADVGNLAAPGTPLVELEGRDQFEIEAGIPDSLTARVKIGMALPVFVPASNTSFDAHLAELSSAADAQARTVLAKLAVPPGTAVRSGQFARVQLPGAPTRALLAPASAVSTLGQMERVFVAVDSRAVLRLVKTGRRHGQDVEILAGVDSGEFVIIDPPATLREGQPLETRP